MSEYKANNGKEPSKRLWVSLIVIGAGLAIIGAVLFPVGDVIIREQIEKVKSALWKLPMYTFS